MKCDKAQEFFSDYIENSLDRPMTVALETHLSGCEACSADVADLRSMWTVLDKVPQVEPPADFVWRTTTRLQNELLNRREAERARPLPWWKRLTPVQSFSYAGIAAMLIVGLTIGVHNKVSDPTQTWDILGWLHPHQSANDASRLPQRIPVTPPSFDVEVPGANGMAASVMIKANSTMPGAYVAVALLTPVDGVLKGYPQAGRRATWAAGETWTIPIQNGGARAAEIFVYSGNQLVAQKRLILPPAAGTQPVTSLQNADPYFALQQIAGRTGRPILVDSGLATPVTVDLTSGTPQQALDQAVSQINVKTDSTRSGVISLTR